MICNIIPKMIDKIMILRMINNKRDKYKWHFWFNSKNSKYKSLGRNIQSLN